MITYGPCIGPGGDGKWRIKSANRFVDNAVFEGEDAELRCSLRAKAFAAGGRFIRTVYAVGDDGGDLPHDPTDEAPVPVELDKLSAESVEALGLGGEE